MVNQIPAPVGAMAVTVLLPHPSVPERQQQALAVVSNTWISDGLDRLYLGVEPRMFIYDMFIKSVRVRENVSLKILRRYSVSTVSCERKML